MNRYTMKTSVVLLLLSSLLLSSYAIALAHGHVHVGKDDAYELVIGFSTEPAYAGMPNGLDLTVTHVKEERAVEKLEETLKAEISFGAAKKELPLRAKWGTPGSYTTDVIPAQAGDYTWRIFGEIEGEAIDVSMTSSPEGTFSPVRAMSDAMFPPVEAASQSGNSQLPLLLGVVGTVLGLVGTGLGLRGGRKAA